MLRLGLGLRDRCVLVNDLTYLVIRIIFLAIIVVGTVSDVGTGWPCLSVRVVCVFTTVQFDVGHLAILGLR